MRFRNVVERGADGLRRPDCRSVTFCFSNGMRSSDLPRARDRVTGAPSVTLASSRSDPTPASSCAIRRAGWSPPSNSPGVEPVRSPVGSSTALGRWRSRRPPCPSPSGQHAEQRRRPSATSSAKTGSISSVAHGHRVEEHTAGAIVMRGAVEMVERGALRAQVV